MASKREDHRSTLDGITRGRAREAIAATCFTWCLGVLGWAINSVTHHPWMGASFAAVGVLGLACLLRLKS